MFGFAHHTDPGPTEEARRAQAGDQAGEKVELGEQNKKEQNTCQGVDRYEGISQLFQSRHWRPRCLGILAGVEDEGLVAAVSEAGISGRSYRRDHGRSRSSRHQRESDRCTYRSLTVEIWSARRLWTVDRDANAPKTTISIERGCVKFFEYRRKQSAKEYASLLARRVACQSKCATLRLSQASTSSHPVDLVCSKVQ